MGQAAAGNVAFDPIAPKHNPPDLKGRLKRAIIELIRWKFHVEHEEELNAEQLK